MSTATIREIKKLSVAERILLVEKIWETIPDESDELVLSAEQSKELDRRIKSIENGTARFVSWNEVRENLRKRRK